MLVRELDCVTGVVSSLEAGHDVEVLTEKIDDLSLPFVSPLGPEDGQIPLLRDWHRQAETIGLRRGNQFGSGADQRTGFAASSAIMMTTYQPRRIRS